MTTGLETNFLCFSGGCLCGAVRYTASGGPQFTGDCYCLDCRRSSGTAHSSHIVMAKSAVAITGKVSGFDKPADSGNIVTRCFCPNCGTPIYSANSAMSDLLFLRALSLDDPEIYSVQMTVYTSRAPSWARIEADAPAFEAMPPRAPVG